MKVGVTGSQKGWTPAQKVQFQDLIDELRVEEFHHGDCIGVDEQAVAEVRREHGEVIHTHPPINSTKRAMCGGHLYAPKEYLDRNHDIVDSVDILIVVPATDEEIIRSGTWATYRYAMKGLQNGDVPVSKVVVIFPDGRMEHHHP